MSLSGQMVAMRYGTLPIARAVGGLVDTIEDPNTSDKPDGFLFNDYDVGGLRYGVSRAFAVYKDKSELLKMRRNAMKSDHSWKKAAAAYLKLYTSK